MLLPQLCLQQYQNRKQYATGLLETILNAPNFPVLKHFTKDGEKIKNIQDQIMEQKQLQGCESENKNWVSHSKSQDNSLQTNAEDFDPLQQHKTVLKYIMQNSSSFFTLSSIIKKQSNEGSTTVFKSIPLRQYLVIWLQKLRQFKPDLVDLFISYTESQKNCLRFLQHLYYSYPAHIVHITFKYIFFIWELYYPYLHSTLTIEAKMQVSQNISTKIYQAELQSIKKSQNSNHQKNKGLRRMMKVLAVTFVLVMQKYSKNPYFTFMIVKRQIDVKQDEQNLINQNSRKRQSQ